MGERSKSKYGKDAFYARHADSLRKNPYFRAYAKSTWEEGGETNEPCPNGTHWDPVLQECVPDENKPNILPTREQLFSDPEYRQNIDRLEYNRDVRDYKNYRNEKLIDYRNKNYKGPMKQYDDGRPYPDRDSPEWEQYLNSKEYQDLENKIPDPEFTPGWQLQHQSPDNAPNNVEHYPLIGPWNEQDQKRYDEHFDPATDDYPENFDENGEFLYKPKRMLKNSQELKEQLNDRYENWCPCSKKEELMVNGRPTVKEVCIPCEQAEYGGEMRKYAPGGSTDWPPASKNKTYLTYSPFYGNSLTGQSSNMGYADNPFSDEKSDFFKVNTIRMPQSYIGISGGADPYGKFNHNQGIMKKLGYDAYVGLPYNYDPNNTNYYSNTPSVGGRIRYNNTIDNQWLGIPWNKVFVEASGDYSQSDGLNANFSLGTRFDGTKGRSKGYFEPHLGVSGSWGPHNIKPGAYSAAALAEYQQIMGSNEIPDLEGDSVNMSDPMIQNLISDIYNENIENPLAKGKKQQGAMGDIDLGFKTGFEWQPKWLTKRLPGSKIFGDLRYSAQPMRGMWVSGMGENSQSSVGNYNGVQTSLSDQGETNKLAFSHQFTGGLGLKVPIGTVKDKINDIDFTRTRIPKVPKDCRCPDGTIVDRLEDGSCPCDDHNEECPPCPDGSVPRRLKDGTCPCQKTIEVDEYARHPRWLRDGGMIKRADGSYSQRGLWDNIRANAGSGKEPTREMLQQERKIRKKAMGGIMGPDDCEEGFVWNDIYQMCVPIGSEMIDPNVGKNYLKNWYSKRLNVINNPGFADAVGAENVRDHTNFLNQTVPLINEQLINKYPTTNYVDELEGIVGKGEYVYDKKNPQINIVKKYMTNPIDFAATQVHEGSTYANEANQKALNSYITPIQNAIIAQNIKSWDEFFRDNNKVDKSNRDAVRELEQQYDYSTDPRQDNIHSNVHASRYLFNLLPDEIITEEKMNSMIEEGTRKGYLDISSPNYHDDFYRLTRLAKNKRSLVNLFNLLASNDIGLNDNDLQMAKHGGNIRNLRKFF